MANYDGSLNAVFHALSDPTRRAVIQRLSVGEATVSQLAEPFDMALPSFVKHITVLEQSRLIKTKKRGRVRTCWLEHEHLVVTERWFNELRSQWASRYENLDALLLNLKGDEGGH